MDETDTTSLDFGSRNSPQPRQKELHHLHSVDEDGEIILNNSSTIKGRRSPEDRFRRTQTVSPLLTAPETYNVPPKRLVKQHSADVLQSDSHYHVPKPSTSSEYEVPRPYNDPRNSPDYYHQPTPANQTYKIPIPYSRNGAETYDSPKVSPKPVRARKMETDKLYGNVANGSNQTPPEDFYNVPKNATSITSDSSWQNPPNIYNVPTHRRGSHKTPGTDFTDGESLSPKLHKLRTVKSAESLLSTRINPNPVRHISPPEISPENMYIDIDQQVSTGDNLYAVISDSLPRRPQMTGNGSGVQNSLVPQPSLSSSQSDSGILNYEQLPSRIGSQIQKQRNLTRDGYELCLPAEVDPTSFHAMTLPHKNNHSSTSPPPLRKHRGTSLEKYDIHLPNVRSSRPRSEADLLEGVDFSKSNTNPNILGSSIPNESSFPIVDEYVIVTHPNNRQQYFPTDPQAIPNSNFESTNQNDEYQVMSAVKIDRSHLLYDTPNQSPSSNGGQSYDSKTEPPTKNVSHDLVQETHYDTVNPINYPPKESQSSLEMEGINLQNSRQFDPSKTLSLGSLSSVFSEPEVEGQAEGMAIPNKERIRIASGSPRDTSGPLELK